MIQTARTSLPAAARAALLAALLASPAAGQEAPGRPEGLSLELNKAETVESGCRLTYVLRNDTGSGLAGLSVAAAVFDAAGVFDRRVLFRFGGIGAGRAKVQQFDLVGLPCRGLSRLLIEEVGDCAPASGSAPDCAALLDVTSGTAIALDY